MLNRIAMPTRMSRGLSRNGRRTDTTGMAAALFLGIQQILQLAHELADVPEVPVHRRKAYIRDLVQVLQLLHDERADLGGGDLLLRPLLQHQLHAIADVLDGRHTHRTLLARFQETSDQLLPLEPFARAVLLDDHVRDLVNPLITRKPLVTISIETLTPPSNNVAFFAFARIDDLVAHVSAVRTLHRFTSA